MVRGSGAEGTALGEEGKERVGEGRRLVLGQREREPVAGGRVRGWAEVRRALEEVGRGMAALVKGAVAGMGGERVVVVGTGAGEARAWEMAVAVAGARVGWGRQRWRLCTARSGRCREWKAGHKRVGARSGACDAGAGSNPPRGAHTHTDALPQAALAGTPTCTLRRRPHCRWSSAGLSRGVVGCTAIGIMHVTAGRGLPPPHAQQLAGALAPTAGIFPPHLPAP